MQQLVRPFASIWTKKEPRRDLRKYSSRSVCATTFLMKFYTCLIAIILCIIAHVPIAFAQKDSDMLCMRTSNGHIPVQISTDYDVDGRGMRFRVTFIYIHEMPRIPAYENLKVRLTSKQGQVLKLTREDEPSKLLGFSSRGENNFFTGHFLVKGVAVKDLERVEIDLKGEKYDIDLTKNAHPWFPQ